MNYTAGEYAVDPPLLGIDFTEQGTTPKYSVGMYVRTNLGNEYRYVKWTAAKTRYLVYVLDEDGVVGSPLDTSTDNAAPIGLGIFNITPISGSGAVPYYGWIQTAGNFPEVELLQSVQINVELYSSATAGKLDDSSAGKLVHGLTNVEDDTDAGAASRKCYSPIRLCLPSDS